MFVFAFALWPVLSFLGMGGFSSLVGLTGLAGLIAVRPRLTWGAPLLVAIVWLVWSGYTASFVPGARPLITGNLLEGNFGVNSPALRLGLVLVFAAACLAGALSLKAERLKLSHKVMLAGLGVNGLVVLLYSAFQPQASALLAGLSEEVHAQPQNAYRNTVVFGLGLSLLIAPLLVARALWMKAAAAAVVVLYALACWQIQALASLLVLAILPISLGLVTLMPRRGIAVTLAGLAGLVASAPVWMSALVSVGRAQGESLHFSAQSRLGAWGRVLELWQEKPITGNGMRSSLFREETFSQVPGWQEAGWKTSEAFRNYPIIPGHPHNMPIQVWMETGAIGAGLATLMLLALAWRLRDTGAMSRAGRLAAGGLIAAAVVPVMVSFNVWNDGFWGAVAMAACGVIVLDRQARMSGAGAHG